MPKTHSTRKYSRLKGTEFLSHSLHMTKDLNGLNRCRGFSWGSKKSLVAWNQICIPKHEGGLDFRDI